MMYTSIQDRIDETVDLAMDMINRNSITDEQADELIVSIKDLGYQWQQANAYGRAMRVVAAIMSGAEWNPMKTSAEELKQLESIGSDAIFQAVPLPLYYMLVMQFLQKPEEDDDAGRTV